MIKVGEEEVVVDMEVVVVAEVEVEAEVEEGKDGQVVV